MLQQNGSAKRKYQHIVEVGLSHLAHASMPLKFWDKAFLTTAYLINRLPSRVISFDTPLERLFLQNNNYISLCTFGCSCWPNLHPYHKHKLQFRSKHCVLLGYYSIMHKGFKCLDVAEGDYIFHVTPFFMSLSFPSSLSIPMQAQDFELRFLSFLMSFLIQLLISLWVPLYITQLGLMLHLHLVLLTLQVVQNLLASLVPMQNLHQIIKLKTF